MPDLDKLEAAAKAARASNRMSNYTVMHNLLTAATVLEMVEEIRRLRWLAGIKGDGSKIDKMIEANIESYALWRDGRYAALESKT